jgi:hypothetical protein
MLDLERIAAPADDVVSLAEVKAHLAIDIDRWDGMLGAMIAAATQYLDGADGILRRALDFAAVATLSRPLPLPPLRAHPQRAQFRPSPPASGRRDRATAAPARFGRLHHLSGQQWDPPAVDPAVYQVLDGERATVQPARGQAWPSALCEPRSIEVTFTAGYGDATQLPMPLVQTVLLMVGDLFANREAQQIADSRVTVVENPTVKALLAPYRVLRI